MKLIEVKALSKEFVVHKKQPGLLGSIRSAFRREWQTKIALNQVDLDVSEGEVLGLVGANGAGKTTLVKILAGIIHPTSGQVRVLGHEPFKRLHSYRMQMSLIMGQKAQLWWDLPAADCFLLIREIYRIPHADFRKRLDQLSQILGVADLLTTQIRRLSLGERMKMELIAALLHEPKVVYLDEPTIGLDFTAQRAVREFIASYSKEHQPAMILTSHYIEDIRRLCERLVIINSGRIVYDGLLRHLVARFAQNKIIRWATTDTPLVPAELGQVKKLDDGQISLHVPLAKLADATHFILQQLHVTDFVIEDEDITAIIETLMNQRSAA